MMALLAAKAIWGVLVVLAFLAVAVGVLAAIPFLILVGIATALIGDEEGR
jgi:hypothetical protein